MDIGEWRCQYHAETMRILRPLQSLFWGSLAPMQTQSTRSMKDIFKIREAFGLHPYCTGSVEHVTILKKMQVEEQSPFLGVGVMYLG
jgi:hypothetical protein